MLTSIVQSSNNNQNDSFFQEYDVDQDGYITIDELFGLVLTIINNMWILILIEFNSYLFKYKEI